MYDPLLDVEALRLGALVGPDMARREELVDALVEDRDSVWLSEKKRRVDDDRFGGLKDESGGDSGGEFGPRRWFNLPSATSHSVHGCVCDSPMCPHPLCWV